MSGSSSCHPEFGLCVKEFTTIIVPTQKLLIHSQVFKWHYKVPSKGISVVVEIC